MSLIGSAAAACSTDTMRFAENPFSNPFAASDRFDTGAAPASDQTQVAAVTPAVPTPSVQAQSLPPVQSQPLAQPSQVASAPVAPVVGSANGWSAAGGTQITVGGNDNLNTISQRYGVPASAILAASGLSNASQVKPGQRVVIPVYNAGGNSRVASAPAPVRSTPAAQPAAQPKFRLVENSKAAATPIEPVNNSGRARPGIATAQVQPVAAKPAPVQVASATAEPLVSAPKPLVEQKVAAISEPQPVKPAVAAQPVAPAPAPQPVEAAKAPAPEPEQTASISGDFRWPARGRVIAGFGANGGNEGINIAVPEGTPVKAAEAGTVTYAGSEVKGYGNLVLIRHENGYVSAYAHNGSLNVKRGEQVKRGQVIATSGQTGNVTSPQLHFEIRKGATPVDPMKYLGG
ncbi:peptidoglycan DD-metalloendopeptidase family protein [Microvirga lenta]|uniref:peptidoglycan DD-metalloendopeptidase family protein n=1 Tax=Microvirga lenta TaxID=2881337 RepID=UPI001CFF6574|nr:peptidoglycan DD-metalloendopeptidase family protein [Microvirga lenta]MCB5176999.1 peptidoglycan DD-metalloendopeptidase family protein [Microvirga lenta]